MTVLKTARMTLRELTPADAPFIRELVNEPSWIRYIGDRGVRTDEDARAYLVKGPIAMYELHGFGLWLCEARDTGEPLGICGLIKRDTLEDVDIGFAFVPRHWGRGYAHESAAAVLEHGRRVLGMKRIVAITSPDNEPSIKLLEKLGLKLEKTYELAGMPTRLYAG
jgi:RimJ/RimL family protein N-acetyltransferase